MPKLSQQTKDFINLLLRSPNLGGGWRQVSGMLAQVSTRTIALNPELYITEHVEGEVGFRVKLSQRGQEVADYL